VRAGEPLAFEDAQSSSSSSSGRRFETSTRGSLEVQRIETRERSFFAAATRASHGDGRDDEIRGDDLGGFAFARSFSRSEEDVAEEDSFCAHLDVDAFEGAGWRRFICGWTERRREPPNCVSSEAF